MKYQTILLDMDGTLIDSRQGILRSVHHALTAFDMVETDADSLVGMIGIPLHDLFQVRYGFSLDKANEAVSVYREYYRDRGIFECELYPGTGRLLESITADGASVALATSKAEVFAERILEHFGLTDRFDFIAGADLAGNRAWKAGVIERALEALGQPDRSSTVMVGDREHDILGAKACGLGSIGVTWGYGTADELLTAGAGALAETPDELGILLLP